MISLIGLALTLLIFFLLQEQINQYPNLVYFIMGIYIILLATVLSPLDHYLGVTSKPIVKKRGTIIGKTRIGASWENKKYVAEIYVQDGEKISLGISQQQYKMLNKNDVAIIVYQGFAMRSFQRATDKKPIKNEYHFPSNSKKNKNN